MIDVVLLDEKILSVWRSDKQATNYDNGNQLLSSRSIDYISDSLITLQRFVKK